MIRLAVLLVALGAALTLLGAILGDLGWLYGAITVAISALLVLAAGVARATRRVSAADPQDAPGDTDLTDTHDPAGAHDPAADTHDPAGDQSPSDSDRETPPN